MRQENYLIALFNKDLLDLRVRIPLPASVRKIVPPALLRGPPQATLPKTTGAEEPQYLTFGGNVLTLALEHNLRVCLFSFLFGPTGEVRKEVVHGKGRKDLVTR
jgi:autophagy-related protein 9